MHFLLLNFVHLKSKTVSSVRQTVFLLTAAFLFRLDFSFGLRISLDTSLSAGWCTEMGWARCELVNSELADIVNLPNSVQGD